MKTTKEQAGFLILAAMIAFAMIGCKEDNGSRTRPVDTDVTVTVSPAATHLGRGGTYSFSAAVTGANNPAQTVTWSIVQNNKHPQTNISTNGFLTVNAEEPLNSLTIRATSTVDTSGYGEAIVTITNEELIPTVNGVTVSPPSAQVAKGRTRSFSAAVTGANSPVQTVTWSIVQTNKHEHTTINASGLLTINVEETLSTLTVRATSTADKTKYGEAAVTITESGIELNCPDCGAATNSAEWITAQEAACTAAGKKELRCAGCQAVLDTDTIEATGHDWYWETTIPATTTATGLKEEKCSHCDAVNDTEIIPRIPGGLQITIDTDGKMICSPSESGSNAVITGGVLILKRSATATLTLENAAAYTNIRWRVQNTTVSGSGVTFTLNGNNAAFAIGRNYFVTAEALRNIAPVGAAPYSVTIIFKVEE